MAKQSDALTRVWRVGASFYLLVSLGVLAIPLLGMVEPAPITATEQAAIRKVARRAAGLRNTP